MHQTIKSTARVATIMSFVSGSRSLAVLYPHFSAGWTSTALVKLGTDSRNVDTPVSVP